MVHVGVKIPEDALDALRDRAHRDDRTVSAEIRRAIRAHLGDDLTTREGRPAQATSAQADAGGPQPRRLPPHRVERSTSPFPYVTPDEHWEMREAITRVLSAWYSTACVGGNSDAEAARITIEELTPYRIESAGNADAEVPDA